MVPPAEYNQQQLQQQVWDVADEAAAEAALASQPDPDCGRHGRSAAMVAAALLSVRMARRYHAQQVEQWRRQMQEQRRRQAEELVLYS